MLSELMAIVVARGKQLSIDLKKQSLPLAY